MSVTEREDKEILLTSFDTRISRCLGRAALVDKTKPEKCSS